MATEMQASILRQGQKNRIREYLKKVNGATTTLFAYLKKVVGSQSTPKRQLQVIDELRKEFRTYPKKQFGDAVRNASNSLGLIQWFVEHSLPWKSERKSVLENIRRDVRKAKSGKGKKPTIPEAPKGVSGGLLLNIGMQKEIYKNICELQSVSADLQKLLRTKAPSYAAGVVLKKKMTKLVKRFNTAARNCGWDKLK